MNINTARFHSRRALPPRAPLRLCCRKIRRIRRAPAVCFYLFSPKINTARFHPRRTLPPRAPLRLCCRKIRRIRRAPAVCFYLFSPKINTARSHPRWALPPRAPLRLCRRKIQRVCHAPAVCFYLFSPKINTARFHPRRTLPPSGSPAALLPEDSAQPKGFQRPLSFLFYALHKNTAKPYNPPPRCSGSAVGGSIFITPETASAYTACAEKCCRPSAGRSA